MGWFGDRTRKQLQEEIDRLTCENASLRAHGQHDDAAVNRVIRTNWELRSEVSNLRVQLANAKDDLAFVSHRLDSTNLLHAQLRQASQQITNALEDEYILAASSSDALFKLGKLNPASTAKREREHSHAGNDSKLMPKGYA